MIVETGQNVWYKRHFCYFHQSFQNVTGNFAKQLTKKDPLSSQKKLLLEWHIWRFLKITILSRTQYIFSLQKHEFEEEKTKKTLIWWSNLTILWTKWNLFLISILTPPPKWLKLFGKVYIKGFRTFINFTILENKSSYDKETQFINILRKVN